MLSESTSQLQSVSFSIFWWLKSLVPSQNWIIIHAHLQPLVEMIRPYTTSANETVALGNETTTLATTTMEASTEAPTHTQFDWTETDKQLILGSFFWGYILTELPGGRLAELVGGHRVFGHSMLWASVLTLITPFAANLGLAAMVTQRALLGFCLGGQ